MSDRPNILVAKKRSPGRPVLSLERHLLDTALAAQAVFRLDRRWGQNCCRFFRISPESEASRFVLNLGVAALFHDIGKANLDFDQAMSIPGGARQTVRHEHISAMVLHLPEVRAWLKMAGGLDLEAITAAVLCHHLKAAAPDAGPEEYRWAQPRTTRPIVRLFLDHGEIERTLKTVAELAKLPPPPELPADPIQFLGDGSIADPWGSALRAGRDAARAFERELRKNNERRSFLRALKAGLIAADSVASALFRENKPIEAWVDEVAHASALAGGDVQRAVIGPRLRSISELVKRPVELKDFQREVAKQGRRCLLLASCGSGKTLAAWAWAQRQLDEQALGRVIFLYPTRGTATEGFRDYVGWAPEGESELLHGTSEYELESIAENPPESLRDKDPRNEAAARLFALSHWPRRYFSATTDQFLAFLEHRYESLCLLPVLADAALIIDEVHSYDRAMFRSLITFLHEFDCPVLCMTATLPEHRREQLVEAGLTPFPGAADRAALAELEEAEQAQRYRLHVVASAKDCVSHVSEALARELRILWVVNTVDRCQARADRLAELLNAEVLCYHSRYKLEDRRSIHEACVRAFQQKRRAAIAVTTQVCEMSLDLDADVLITEYAPVTSLVQRFGRANRHHQPGSPLRGELLAYPPEMALPYEPAELKAAAAFLADLDGRELSQRDLALALESHCAPEARVDAYASFTASGYYAVPGSFRDTDDFNATAVLDRDADEVLRRIAAHLPWDGYRLPVPRPVPPFERPRGRLPSFVRIVSGASYRDDRGFIWRGEENG